MNLYIVNFKDGSSFCGGNCKNTKWMEIPDKAIKNILYFTPSGKKIFLENYNSYYHFVEATNDLSGEKKGQIQLEYTYLIGKKDRKCKVHKINLKNGKIEITDLDIDNKFIQQLNPIGWKGQ